MQNKIEQPLTLSEDELKLELKGPKVVLFREEDSLIFQTHEQFTQY